MKKRIKALPFVLALVLVLAFGFTGCAQNEEAPSASAQTEEAGQAEQTAQPPQAEQSTGGVIKIATKPMTEQLIIGRMLKTLIENNTGLTVEMTEGVGGGTGNIHPAMVKGDFDMYPEYTGTGWKDVLKKEETPDDETLFSELTKEYAEQFGFEWVGMYGFGNMYGIAVRDEIANEHGLETFSDLAEYTPELVFGAEYDFYERYDGYEGLCELYSYGFKDTRDLDIGLKYQAINSGQIDVMTIFTTDGQLAVSEITELKDDKAFFPTYYAGTVVRSDTLEANPGLRDVLMMMEGLISTEEMAAMNYAVEGEGKDPYTVADDFLKEKGLL
ncbi:MAG: glycine betaine ABC transporter substrate-binding protein [Christensenellaceae bacterium]|jgi:osmoprotectant transport system substrate-binding protein